MLILDKIERRRRALHLKQNEIERRAGLAPNRISKWRGGQGEPTAKQALGLARALLVPMEWLVNDEAEGEPPAEGAPPLTRDEEAILDVIRSLELDRKTAIRRLVPRQPKAAVKPPGRRNGDRAG